MRKLVCFYLGDRELSAPIEVVRETVALRPVTPVFRTPPCVAGITNLRGEILAVLDTALLLGLPPCARGDAARIVIVEPDDRAAGLLVDGLGPIRDVEEDDVAPVPPTMPQAVATMMEGVVSLPDRPVGLLDVGRLLRAPELAPFAPTDRRADTVAGAAAPEGTP